MPHVYAFKIKASFIKLKAELIYVFLYNMPTTFKKLAIKTIRARGFVNWHRLNHRINLLLGKRD
jgi:hypothetical protein